MPEIKKLTFAPFFLIFLTLSLVVLQPLLSSYEVIFSLDLESIKSVVLFCSLLLLSTLIFTIFAVLAANWLYILPVSILGAITPLTLSFYTKQSIDSQSLVLSVGFLISFCLIYLFISNELKKYVDFRPAQLFAPHVKNLANLLVLVLTFGYFLSINSQIAQKGFELPDPLIDAAIKFSMPSGLEETNVRGIKITQAPTITPEQIEMLRQNPDLLRQYGVDPAILDNLPTPTSQRQTTPSRSTTTSQTSGSPDLTNELVKQLVKSQFQNFIKPYLSFIPPILAGLFLLTLFSIVSFLSILVGPLIGLIFLILEKSNFVKFEKETREVKKLVL